MSHQPAPEDEILLTFGSTHAAIAAEHALLAGGLEVRVMSLPSAIRAGCGICLRVAPGDLPQANRLLTAACALPGGLYHRLPGGQYSPYAEGDHNTEDEHA